MKVMATTTFEYRGVKIRAEDERLSLTDMWKASGADSSRRPSYWLRSADAGRFIGFLAEMLNVRDSHSEQNQGLVRAVRDGGDSRTEAHWQIGIAYAKYLSPEFHVWCNTVVRDRMEGKLVPTGTVSLTEKDFERLTDQTKQIVAPIVEGLHALTGRVDSLERNLPQRRPILPKTKAAIIAAVIKYGRHCPCCGEVEVVTPDGSVIDAEFDHFFSNQLPNAKHAWLICKPCHRALTDGTMDRAKANVHFASFQLRLEKMLPPAGAKPKMASRGAPS
jgi:hypothetical protein